MHNKLWSRTNSRQKDHIESLLPEHKLKDILFTIRSFFIFLNRYHNDYYAHK